ncbi:MAG: glycosyltransferase family 4 protein [Acidimicrobiia bacterium]|nr:glycosyltransferase family 4 protein [Acidimicrobiia bacterium]
MRVASVAFTNYDADPRVRRMSEALVDRGDSVTAITLTQEGKPARRTVSGVEVIGIDIPQYRGSSIRAYLAQYLRFLAAASWRLTRLHLAKRFDVVHVNNMPDFLVFSALPAKLLGAKVILDLHDPMPELYAAKFDSGLEHPLVRGVIAVERASVGFADKAISVQQVHIDTFVSHGNRRGKFVEVQNAADTALFPEGAAAHRPDDGIVRVVYHGTMAPRLGLDTLIRAADDLRHRHPNLRVLLIGDGDDSDRLETLIAERDLGDIVDFRRGFIPVNDLLPHLQTCDIGVVPAGEDPFTSTMLPSKLLEYVTLGIPTACADLPAVRRYFDDDQLALFPPGDVEALTRVLDQMIDDPEGRRDQAKRAMRFLEQHGWEQERQRYVDLIDDLARA